MERNEGIKRLLLVIALAVWLGLALFYSSRMHWFSADDAYITLRYAEHWAEGHGPVYNIGERVEGYTNFLWVLVLTPLITLGIPGPLAVKLLAGFSGAGALWLIWLLGRRIAGKDSWLGPVAALALALNGTFIWWTLPGSMEVSTLAVTLLAGFYLLLGREKAEPRERLRETLGAGVLFGLSVLLRPDAVLFGIPALVVVVMRKERRLLRTLLFLAPGALMIAGQLIFRLSYYGDWLPNTFYAKVDINLRVIGRGLEYLLGFLKAQALIFVGAIFFPWKRWGAKALPFLTGCLLYWVYLVAIGGDWMSLRLFHHTLPILVLVGAAGYLRLFGKLSDLRWGRVWVGGLTVVALAGYLYLSHLAADPSMAFSPLRFGVQHRYNTARWLSEYGKPADRVALTSTGIIPYFTDLYTIDMVGLMDPHIAREGISIAGFGLPGHERYDNDYVLAYEPEWFVLNIYPDEILSGAQPSLFYEMDLLKRGGFWADYHLVLPRRPTLSILHRRDDVEGLGRLDPRDWEQSYHFTPL
ncbi:glycosyltransferase family 39 protein [bacterium]|nr:glycosyltransferase family 39 protein [bacterium]